MNAPDPLVPVDCDVRDLDGFMLNVERLLSSELWALTRHNPEAFRGAVGLWARAWKQVPGASLPADDAVIAAFADMPLPKFKKLRGLVMHGFVLCNDGRYYHRVLAPEAVRAFEKKKAYLARRETDKKRLDEWRKKHPRNGVGNDDETRFTSPTSDVRNADVAEDTIQGQGQVVKEEEREKLERSESPSRSLRSPADYVFSGAVIRLVKKDYDNWRKSFSALPDLTAELETIDAKLSEEGMLNSDKWFGKVAGWLQKKHDRIDQERRGRERSFGSPGFA